MFPPVLLLIEVATLLSLVVGIIPSAYTSAVLIRTVIPSFWAVIFSELVDTVLRSARHEEQNTTTAVMAFYIPAKMSRWR